ncbi:CHASE2 domain-containing protein [Caenimonas koreensis DSM 17982]|uniref:non-specific serine/threonine protein kinase n=1 Tax=Caenimonas koreensis DSM 17982 TaxID=1121255 RepID=A0A844BAL9_9BURK|nr:serine/threonine-protein kinase [Caenimonas koreensis]MRD48629.1 CHASE2 domain-containing protein [Caenimonas koreensis DSM 17982]
MSTSSSAKRGQFWRTDWFVAVLVVLAVFAFDRATDSIQTLERRFYDYGSTSSGRTPSDRIAVIAIDDQSIANIGRWPWPRDVHADMINKLSAAKAKTIVNTTFFFEPQTDRGLVFIRKLKEALGPVPEGQGGIAETLSKTITEAEKTLDTDAQLAASMGKAGNVVIPSVFQLGEPQGKVDTPLPPYALKSTVRETNGFSIPALRTTQPIPAIGEAAAGIGHLNLFNDVDGSVRNEPLLVNYDGNAVPSLALLASLKSLNLTPADIKLNTGESVQIGKLRIKTDEAAKMLPQFYRGRDGKPPFAIDSFYDVLSGKIPATKYADKIVLIGATAAGVGVQSPVPGYAAVTPVEMIAHITSSILSEHFIVQPGWGGMATFAVFLIIAAYLIAALPRLSAGMAGIITAVLFIVLLGTEFGLLAGASTWLQLVFPATLLVIGHLAVTTKRFLVTEAGKVRSDEESAETNRMMGLALQGQGQLDMAFDRFSRVPMGDSLMDNLYNLALDFERKRQFNKAQAVYEHMAAYNKKYKDLESKLNRAKNLSETVILGGGSSHPGGTMLLDGGAVEKPMLGRYQVEKELGKGAMGVVYLGKDPKIGRVVAIKTMALSQEFEGDELADARERFFREAETAGRLQHQNIVTIFDAGEEHDLAYIAMEFLKGKDLVDQCKDGQLLEMPRVLSIVARVAEALAYAHRQNVVHRDIKPANIMYEMESDTVKVTDFGIARITDSSKTKTGLVLGTPSFMSPEQIAGKKVDGRSDLYSLGVMLFQMLTGVLPFRGDSMAELMYKIANEEAPDIRIIRKEIPEKLANVVALALSKRPETRYQDGDQFAADLRSAQADLQGVSTSAVKAQAKGVVMRPDDEVNTRASEKTAAFSPGMINAAAPAAADPDKTVIMAPAAAAAPRVADSHPQAARPGYDAGQKSGGGDPDFLKTDVFQRPPGSGNGSSGSGNGSSGSGNGSSGSGNGS